MEAVEASLLGLSAEAVVGVDGPVKRDPPASSRFNPQPLHVFRQHPEVRELYAVSRFATRKRVYNQIDKQKRLEVGPLWVISELLHSTRYLNELSL